MCGSPENVTLTCEP